MARFNGWFRSSGPRVSRHLTGFLLVLVAVLLLLGSLFSYKDPRENTLKYVCFSVSFLLLLEQSVTNLVASNNTNLLSHNFRGQKSKIGFRGIKSSCQQA